MALFKGDTSLWSNMQYTCVSAGTAFHVSTINCLFKGKFRIVFTVGRVAQSVYPLSYVLDGP